MRIVVAHESIDTEGGVETYLLSVILELRARGHQVALVYHRRSNTRNALRSSAHVTFGVEELGMDAVIGHLRHWQPNICFSHNMGPLAVDRSLLDTWPVVKMLHGYFGTCVSGLKMHAFPSPQTCHRTFGLACLALYVPRRCGQLSAGSLVNGYRWASNQRGLFSRYASIVVASRYMGEEISHHGVPSDRISVLPLFSTVGRHEAPPSAGETDTVLFAARMTSLKGGDVLIKAAARARSLIGRPVRLLMAGDGPQKESWRQLAVSLNVPIELTGWVDFDDRVSVYSRALFVALPSLWPEPFGLAGLDAAAIGRPAVAFDVGGVRDWLTDGLNGKIVDPARGEEGLAEALTLLLNAPTERQRMGRNACDVARRMSVAAHVDRLEGVLRDAAA